MSITIIFATLVILSYFFSGVIGLIKGVVYYEYVYPKKLTGYEAATTNLLFIITALLFLLKLYSTSQLDSLLLLPVSLIALIISIYGYHYQIQTYNKKGEKKFRKLDRITFFILLIGFFIASILINLPTFNVPLGQ